MTRFLSCSVGRNFSVSQSVILRPSKFPCGKTDGAPALGLFNGWSCVILGMSAFPCPAFLSPFLETQTRFLWETHCVQCLWVGSLSYFSHSGSDEGQGEGIKCPALLISCLLQSGTLKFQSAALKPTPLARLLGSSWDLPVSLLQHWAYRHGGQEFELRSSFVHSKMLLPIEPVPSSSSPFYLLPYPLTKNWIDALGRTSQRVCPAGHSDGGTGAK